MEEISLIADHTVLVILLSLFLQKPVLQPSFIYGNGFLFIREYDHPSSPIRDPLVLHVEFRREKMPENEWPDNKVEQQHEGDDNDDQFDQERFRHK